MDDIVWAADEPKEYRASGNGWRAEVARVNAGTWSWWVELEQPLTRVSGSDTSSAKAKYLAEDALRRLLKAFEGES